MAVQILLHLYKASRRNPHPRISCPAVWSTASQLKVLIHCQTSLEESITVLEESITVVNHPGSRGIMPGQLPARISAIMFEIPSHLQDRYEPKKTTDSQAHSAKIDLEKKWLLKQMTIQNFNIDAQGLRKTRYKNPTMRKIGVTS